MTSAVTTTANLSEQTQRDLESILETLDQRIHEIGLDAVMAAEAEMLTALRGRTAGMLESHRLG